VSKERDPEPAASRPADPGWGGLCPTCAKVRLIKSGKGSTFLMCQHAAVDPRWPKYPPQPVRSCPAFEKVQPQA
jgi:hypothetical protein